MRDSSGRRRLIVGRFGAAIAALAFTVGAASAQMLPLPGQPAPPNPVETKTDCSASGVKAMQEQLDQLETLERTAPETIGLVCKGIESFSAWMDLKDDEPVPGPLNELVKPLIHQNLTPRMIKAMCRMAQGETGRNFRTEIGQLKDRITGCKGI